MKRILHTLKLKWPEYVLEIIVIMIGILGAYELNQWNDSRKLRIKEQQILRQLKSEYESNLIQLDEKILMRQEGMISALSIFQQIDDLSVIDENKLYLNLWTLIRDPTFDPIKNDIIETENLRIIQNDSLIRLLSNWTSEVFQVQELELEYQKFRSEKLVPRLNKLGINRNINHALWKDGYSPTEALDKDTIYSINIGRTKKELALKKVLNDVELEGFIASAMTFHKVTNIQSASLRDRILKILELINREIKE